MKKRNIADEKELYEIINNMSYDDSLDIPVPDRTDRNNKIIAAQGKEKVVSGNNKLLFIIMAPLAACLSLFTVFMVCLPLFTGKVQDSDPTIQSELTEEKLMQNENLLLPAGVDYVFVSGTIYSFKDTGEQRFCSLTYKKEEIGYVEITIVFDKTYAMPDKNKYTDLSELIIVDNINASYSILDNEAYATFCILQNDYYLHLISSTPSDVIGIIESMK